MTRHPTYLTMHATKAHHAGNPPTVIVECNTPWCLPDGEFCDDDGTDPFRAARLLATELLPWCELQGDDPKPGERTPLRFTVPEKG